MLTDAALTLPVPFLDLRSSHDELKAGLLEDFGKLIDSNAFTNGPAVGAFENANPLDTNSPLVLAAGATLRDALGNNASLTLTGGAETVEGRPARASRPGA